MRKQPLVSIIVPVYNVEKYIVKCIESLCAQTYPHIEILLVDDGSKDRSGEICDQFASRDNRIRVIHQENGGLSAARNSGLDMAQGDYLMFVDSDDWVHPNFCEHALALLQENKVEIAGFAHTTIYEDPNDPNNPNPTGCDRKVVVIDNPGFLEAEEAISQIIRMKAPFSYMWNKIYARRLFKGIRFPEGRLYEDMAVSYLLFDLAKGLYVSAEPLYYYLRRRGSLSYNRNMSKGISDRLEILEEGLGFINEHYPNLTEHAVGRMAGNAFAWKVWGSKKEYPESDAKVDRFLKTYKPSLKKDRRPFFFIYYNLRPLLPLYTFYLRIRNREK